MSADSKRVVIVGASHAGCLALRTLFSRNSPTDIPLQITLISPNDQTYYNIASPRLLIEPESIDKVLFDIQDTIDKLKIDSKHSAEYIQGTVEKVDLDKQRIYLKHSDVELEYDNLIIATGTRTECPILKLDNIKSQAFSIQELTKMAEDIKSADSIAIVGGGVSGVEVAGELGSTYGRTKSIDLYTGSSGLLPEFKQCHRDTVSKKLSGMGVQIIAQRVDIDNESHSIIFHDGTKKKYSVVIPCHKHTPNTEFLPASVLNESGYIQTDNNFRLKQYHNVICLGDILEITVNSCVDLNFYQKGVFESTTDYEIFEDESTNLKEYTKVDMARLFAIPIGKNGGIGALFGVPIPSFAIKYSKSRDYFISRAKGFLG